MEPQDAQAMQYRVDALLLKQRVDLCDSMLELTTTLTDREEFTRINILATQNFAIYEEMNSGIDVSMKRFISGEKTSFQTLEDMRLILEDMKRKVDQLQREKRYLTIDISDTKVINGKSKWKSQDPIKLAKNDVVAQVLNYASGVPEDASGDTFFYPENTDNGQCIYKISVNSNSFAGQAMSGLLQASKFMSANGIQGGGQTASIMEDGVDLNKGDLKNINFYKLQGAKQNKFTGATAYLRYQSRVEGLPDLFECDSNSCNIERLKRGWALVASKCKGTKKAF